MNNLCEWYVVSKYCKNERKVFGPPYGDASVDNTQMEDAVPAPPPPPLHPHHTAVPVPLPAPIWGAQVEMLEDSRIDKCRSMVSSS
jgi:hypothetical protein